MHISSSFVKILGETKFQPREFPRSGSKAKDGGGGKKKVGNNTPGTKGGPGGRDRTLAQKRRKTPKYTKILKKWKNTLQKFYNSSINFDLFTGKK